MFRAMCLAAMLPSCFLQSVNSEYQGYKSLKGLEKVGVEVVIVDVGAELDSLEKDFYEQVVTFLEKHGITPVSVREAQDLPGQPILRVYFSFQVDVKNNAAAVQCGMALTQQTLMVRDQSIEPIEAKTWDNSSIALMQPQLIKEGSQTKLDDFLKQFIVDLYKANGKLPPDKKSNEKSA